MRRLALVLVLVAGVVRGEEAWMEDVAAYLRADAKNVRLEILAKRAGAKSARMPPKDKKMIVDGLTDQLKALDKGELQFRELPKDTKFRVGMAGYAWGRRVHVAEVQNERESIVDLEFTQAKFVNPTTRSVVGGATFAETLYLESPTAGWTDGSDQSLEDPIAIIGTKRAEGETMFHAIVLTPEQIEAITKLPVKTVTKK